ECVTHGADHLARPAEDRRGKEVAYRVELLAAPPLEDDGNVSSLLRTPPGGGDGATMRGQPVERDHEHVREGAGLERRMLGRPARAHVVSVTSQRAGPGLDLRLVPVDVEDRRHGDTIPAPRFVTP